MKNNNYIILQSIILILGIIGTTSLSFLFMNPLVYLFSMTVFGFYNILQTIHFVLRKLWLMVLLFIYFLAVGIFGYVQFILNNKELIMNFIGN